MAKTGFIDIVEKIPKESSSKKWKMVYDSEIDGLYWTKPKVSINSEMVKVSHDTYLYISPEKKLEGVFVEYFKTNFTEHNQEYKKILSLLTKEISDNSFTTGKVGKQLDEITSRLSIEIKSDIFKEALQSKNQVRNLDKLLAADFS